MLKSTTTANRLSQLFEKKSEEVLSVYFTAGFPKTDDTIPIIKALEDGGADIVEIGMPFSDPIADGPTIQESNQQALAAGMSIHKLMEQLTDIRSQVEIPIVLMGYINPILQYGLERFCADCQARGVDGLILPDLPMQEYIEEYKPLFDRHGLKNIFLITPQTSEERIGLVDNFSDSFIYMVSSASTTGARTGISQAQTTYFERINNMGLKNPRLIGFGISDNDTFKQACKYAHGAIIGSAFIKMLAVSKDIRQDVISFVKSVKGLE